MDKNILEKMVNDGMTQKEIGESLDIKPSSVVYWLKKHHLNTKKQKTSIIWTLEKDKLSAIAEDSDSLADILRKLYKGHVNSALYKMLKRRIAQDDIDISHLKLGRGSNKGRIFERRDKDEWVEYIENQERLHSNLKNKIIEYDLIPHSNCRSCGLDRVWNGEVLNLQLDHIDGNPRNNKLINLRFICPNCHTQTKTYAGRNREKEKTHCRECGVLISRKSERCMKCFRSYDNEVRKTKIEWPSADDLKIMVWETPTQVLSKELGVSDVAIAKRCKKLNIPKPPRGYWAKR